MTENNIDPWDEYRVKIDVDYKPQVLTSIENGEIGLLDTRLSGKQYYWVDLDRIKTPRDLLEWVYHLSGKEWVTKEHMEQFIQAVFSYRDWTLYKGV